MNYARKGRVNNRMSVIATVVFEWDLLKIEEQNVASGGCAPWVT